MTEVAGNEKIEDSEASIENIQGSSSDKDDEYANKEKSAPKWCRNQ